MNKRAQKEQNSFCWVFLHLLYYFPWNNREFCVSLNSVFVSDWEMVLYSRQSQQSQHILLFYSRIYKICISRSTATKNELFRFVIYNFACIVLILLSRSFCFVAIWVMENSFEPGSFINIYVSNHSWENALQLTAVKN